jgi:hypothetical protein
MRPKTLRPGFLPTSFACLLAAGLLLAPAPSLAQGASSGTTATADDYRAKAAQYALARRAFEEQAAAYWKSIGEKRQIRKML